MAIRAPDGANNIPAEEHSTRKCTSALTPINANRTEPNNPSVITVRLIDIL